jgi:signal transduction histidine kinase
VDLLGWVRRDLRQTARWPGREEIPILAVSAVAVVLAAQLNEPGTTRDLVLLVLAGIVMAVHPLLPTVPYEVVAFLVLVPVSLAIGHGGHLEVSFFLVVTMTLYAAWHLGSTLRASLIAAVSVGVIVLVAAIRPGAYSWEPWTAAEIFTLVLGRALYRQRLLIGQLEAAREALADQAVADERRRIARELHDLAGHTLAAVLLHVTGARHVLRRDVDEAERALLAAEGIGRASMDEIRAAVAALRTNERGTDPPLAQGDGLDRLVEEYRRAGLSINATIAPDISRQSGPVGVAVHRIVREALANTARHAPANHVVLNARTRADDNTVVLAITDHGRPARQADPFVSSFGLIGMSERARSLGGTVIAEPSADGWRVEAVLPLTDRPNGEKGS